MILPPHYYYFINSTDSEICQLGDVLSAKVKIIIFHRLPVPSTAGTCSKCICTDLNSSHVFSVTMRSVKGETSFVTDLGQFQTKIGNKEKPDFKLALSRISTPADCLTS